MRDPETGWAGLIGIGVIPAVVTYLFLLGTDSTLKLRILWFILLTVPFVLYVGYVVYDSDAEGAAKEMAQYFLDAYLAGAIGAAIALGVVEFRHKKCRTRA